MRERRRKYRVNFKRLIFSLLILALVVIAPIFGIKNFIKIANTNESLNILQTPEEKVPDDITINMVAIGDVMCHSQNYKTSYDSSTKTYDFSPAFVNVAKYISEGDISIRKPRNNICRGEQQRFFWLPNV